MLVSQHYFRTRMKTIELIVTQIMIHSYTFGTSSKRIFSRFGSSANVAIAMGYETSYSNLKSAPAGGLLTKFFLSCK